MMDWRSIDHSANGKEVVELRCSLNSERLVPLARFTARTRRGRVGGGEERVKDGVCVVCFLVNHVITLKELPRFLVGYRYSGVP